MSEQNNQEKSGFKEIVSTSLLIVLLLGIVILLYFSALRFQAEVYNSRATRLVRGEQMDLKQAQTLQEKAINLASFEDRYHRNLSQIYLARVDIANDNQNRIQRLVSGAVNQAQTAVQIAERDVTNWINQASVYQTLMNYAVSGAGKEAENSYQEAIKLAPNNPALYTQLAQVYVSQANNLEQGKKKKRDEYLKKAEEELKQALEIKPNYLPAHFQQALVYNAQGKTDQAIDKFEQLKQVQPQDRTVLFQLGVLYWQNEKLDKAQQQLEQALELNSDFANARYYLGLVYDEQGEKQKAIEQFEKIASTNERNSQQVKSILQNLRAGNPALQGTRERAPEEMTELEDATTTPVESQ